MCYGWHYYKVEIQYESFSDHHGIVVRCAAKATTSPALARVRFPLVSKDFSGWHYYKVESQYESFSDHHSVVVQCAAKATASPDLSRVRFPLRPKDFSLSGVCQLPHPHLGAYWKRLEVHPSL
jgi:hypothetical protein